MRHFPLGRRSKSCEPTLRRRQPASAESSARRARSARLRVPTPLLNNVYAESLRQALMDDFSIEMLSVARALVTCASARVGIVPIPRRDSGACDLGIVSARSEECLQTVMF